MSATTDHILVCPFDQKLISRFKRTALVVRTGDPGLIRYIHREVERNNSLHAIRLQLETPLSELKPEEEWSNIPLLIVAPELGDFREFAAQLPLWRRLDIRIFLPPDPLFNFTALQILSSLQISCGLIFTEDFNAWEQANDLMHYAIYSRTRHAPVEPFHHIASNYGASHYIDYGSVYFNNPLTYIHINESGQVANTEQDLEHERFITKKPEDIDEKVLQSVDQDPTGPRYDYMLSMNECTFCPSFRICLGKFSEQDGKESGCKYLFGEMMEAADFLLMNQTKGRGTWQL